MLVLSPPLNKLDIELIIKDILSNSVSSIEFINEGNVLLIINFVPNKNLVILNSRINNQFQINPPRFFIPLAHLKKIKFNYNIQIKCLELEFNLDDYQNTTVKKKLSVENFDYQYILVNNGQCVINDNQKTDHLSLFIKSIGNNPYFTKLMSECENNSINPKLFLNKLFEKYSEYKNNKKNNLRNLTEKETNIYMNEIDQQNIDLTLNTNCRETSIVNGKQIITIYKSGDVKYNGKLGYWVYLDNILLLFIDSKMIQLIHENETLRNTQDLSNWYYQPEFMVIKEHNNFNKKIIVLIITCAKNINKIIILRKLWVHHLKKLGITCLFVIGNNSSKPTQIVDDVLLVNSSDYYEGLPEKIYRTYQYLYHNFQFNYIYKIDDDTILNPLNLIKTRLKGDYIGIQKKVDKSFNRFWHKGKCQDSSLSNIGYPLNRIYLDTYHAKGESGYFLSKKAIEIILKYEKYIITDLYEDKVFGDVLRKEGIYLTEPNDYQPKLFTNSLGQMNINRFNVIVDVPIGELENVYRKISNLHKQIVY